ncbi:MAG: hypothetical protein QOG39_1421, partial [Acidimicrobiaceae bacterium]
MPHRSPHHLHRPARVLSLVAVLLSLVAATGLTRGASVAGAAVEHGLGYSATVLGFTSWYGSYHLGDVGAAWCIDHGSHAPDAAYGYEPTTVDDVPEATRRSVAWAVGRYGQGPDRVTAAALMLVAHDLMGAVYPHGRIDVDALAPRNLGGFGSDGPEVITRARSIKADALSHAALVAPLELSIEMTPAAAGAPGTAIARVVDHAGTPIAGVDVSVAATGPLMTSASDAMTGPDGTARFAYTAVVGENRLDAAAVLPDPVLHAFASTTHRAQRVAVPATVRLSAVAGFEVLAPTTTTTSTSTSTSTTVPPTTTTAPPPTTTTTTTSAPPA